MRRSSAEEEARYQAKLEGIRRRNEERRGRFLNARSRTIGVDVEALNQQVAEKKAREQYEKESDKSYMKQQSQIDNILKQIQVDDALEQQVKNFEMLNTWKIQARERSPAVEPDDVPVDVSSLGPSSMLNFSGEDKYVAERRLLQAQQQKQWCKDQMEARARAKAAEKEEGKNYLNYLREVDEFRDALEAEEKAMRLKQNEIARDTNLLLAREKRYRDRVDKQESTAAAIAERRSAFNDALLEEGTEDAFLDNGRIRRDAYRGMTQSQVDALRAAQQQQLAEKAGRRQAELQDEKAWARQMKAVCNLSAAAEADLQAEEQQQRLALRNSLEVQAREQRQRRAQQNQEARQNAPSADFFSQFGTSCR